MYNKLKPPQLLHETNPQIDTFKILPSTHNFK